HSPLLLGSILLVVLAAAGVAVLFLHRSGPDQAAALSRSHHRPSPAVQHVVSPPSPTPTTTRRRRQRTKRAKTPKVSAHRSKTSRTHSVRRKRATGSRVLPKSPPPPPRPV